MEIKIIKKANLIRTNLLLIAYSEIKKYEKSLMKINSVSTKKLLEQFKEIKININHPIEFNTHSRRNSQYLYRNFNNQFFQYEINKPFMSDSKIRNKSNTQLICLNSLSNLDDEEFKLNKIIFSEKKNKNIYPNNKEKDEDLTNFSSNESINSINKNLLKYNNKKKSRREITKKYISYLRNFAKTLINNDFCRTSKKHKTLLTSNNDNLFDSKIKLNLLNEIIKNNDNKNKINNNENNDNNLSVQKTESIFDFTEKQNNLNNNLFKTSIILKNEQINNFSTIEFNSSVKNKTSNSIKFNTDIKENYKTFKEKRNIKSIDLSNIKTFYKNTINSPTIVLNDSFSYTLRGVISVNSSKKLDLKNLGFNCNIKTESNLNYLKHDLKNHSHSINQKQNHFQLKKNVSYHEFYTDT